MGAADMFVATELMVGVLVLPQLKGANDILAVESSRSVQMESPEVVMGVIPVSAYPPSEVSTTPVP